MPRHELLRYAPLLLARRGLADAPSAVQYVVVPIRADAEAMWTETRRGQPAPGRAVTATTRETTGADLAEPTLRGAETGTTREPTGAQPAKPDPPGAGTARTAETTEAGERGGGDDLRADESRACGGLRDDGS